MMDFPKYKERGMYHYKWYYDDKLDWYVKCVDSVVDFCKGSTVDAGGGEGLVTSILIEKGYKTLVLDNSQDALNLIDNSAYYSNPDNLGNWFAQCDLNDATSIDGALDYNKYEYLACLNVIEHLSSIDSIKYLFKNYITKAGIIITDAKSPTLGKYHIHEYTKQELVELFKDYKPEYFEPAGGFIGVKIFK